MSGPWILDANVFIRAGDDNCFVEVVQAAAAVSAVVPVAVRNEVGGIGSRKSRPEFRAQAAAIDESGIEVIDIELDTPAAKLFAHLRSMSTGSGNEGECMCIALAAESQQLFVTGEAKAAFLGVGELEGRVRSIPSFLAALVEAGALDRAVACSIVAGSVASQKPSWWDRWSAEQQRPPE